MEQLENKIWYKEKPTKIAERFKFFKRDQLKEETIPIYLDELKKLVTTCEFSAYLEEALCDRFVCGIQDEIIQANLLTKHDLTLDEAYQYALTMEVPGSTEELKPFLKTHKVEEDEVSNFDDFENLHYELDIKEELEPFEQEEFEVQQEFVDLQSEPDILMETECNQQLLQLNDYDGKKKFVCEFCQKTFSRNSRLMDHRRSHTGEKPFICITCDQSFTRREGLRRHTQKLSGCADYDKQKLIKPDKTKVEYVCTVCDRAFLHKGILKRHLKIHTGEKPYVCAICKKDFTRKESLKLHLQLHGFENHLSNKSLSKKTLKCQTCSQTFLKTTDLEQHLKSHTVPVVLNMDEEIPNDIVELADQANEILLPRKSRLQYDKEYHNFEKWMLEKKFTKDSEKVLMGYFRELSESFSPNSLWSKYSMLRSTLLVYKKIDIKNYSRLVTFLKQYSKGYKPKKSNTLTREEVLKFMKEAPDDMFLLEKVVLVMGIFGGLRRDQLVKLNVDDVDDRGAVVVVKIPDAKTGGPKNFTIIEEEEINALYFLRKYTSLRPKGSKERRYFLRYRNGRCSSQVVGKNSFGSVPSKIAKYLGYVDAKAFTGHCLRRASAILLVNAGEDMLTLKRHGQWKSDTVASEYIEESMASKNKISPLIGTSNSEAGTSRDTGMPDKNRIVGKTDTSNLKLLN